VIFVDASIEGEQPFTIRKIEPALKIAFTTHAMGPESVLALCGESFAGSPDTWLVAIRGYGFDIGEELTERARGNFQQALSFIILLLDELKGKSMANAEAKTILIIDDDSDLRAAMRIVLEASGFTVGEAANGEEGFKVADRVKPDAVIVDLMMETVDAGSKVSTKLKESGFKGPIFLLSAAGDTVRYNIDPRELGLAGIFQKPIDHKVLVTTLKKQLRIG